MTAGCRHRLATCPPAWAPGTVDRWGPSAVSALTRWRTAWQVSPLRAGLWMFSRWWKSRSRSHLLSGHLRNLGDARKPGRRRSRPLQDRSWGGFSVSQPGRVP